MYIAINTLGYTACSDCSLISDKKLITEINKADGFTFKVYPGDPIFSLVKTNKCSFITAYDNTEDKVVFRGRITSANPASSDTEASTDVSCEGPLGFLRDSVVYSLNIETNTTNTDGSTTPKNEHFMTYAPQIIIGHNFQVSEELQFRFSYDYSDYYTDQLNGNTKVGILQQDHTFDGVNSLDALVELLEDVGFECYISYEMTVPHWVIHFAPKFGLHAADPIVTGLNLKSMSESLDGSELVTSIIPMGGVGYDEKRLFIKDISYPAPLSFYYYSPYWITPENGIQDQTTGSRYIAYVDNDTLVSKWGRHLGTVIFDDIVANAANEVAGKRQVLYDRALEYASHLSDVEDEFDISVYDLYKTGYDISELKMFNDYTVRDIQLDITVKARLTKKEVDYDNILDTECTFTVMPERSDVS
jgi:hypothetical protein